MNRKVYLTVDLETDWGGRSEKVEAVNSYLEKFVELLIKYNLKCNFFVQSNLSEKVDKSLLKLLTPYTLGSHGDNHLIYSNRNDIQEIEEDIRVSKEKLGNFFSKKIEAFRFPQFRYSKTGLGLLKKHGYKIDSSIVSGVYFPFRYNSIKYPCHKFKIYDIIEYPVSKLLYLPLPMGLLWCKRFKRLGFKTVNQNCYLNIYMHLFDFMNKKENRFLSLWYNSKGEVFSLFEKLILILKQNNFEFKELL